MNVAQILADRPAKVGSVKFIGIDGHGGSGKSTLATMLANNLNAELIHTDDFASHDTPFEWHDALVNSVFKPIISGAKFLNYECSKWWIDHHPEPVQQKPVTKIMIIEGVGALRKEFRQYLSLGIYVDTPDDICLTRGLERDKDQGETPEKLAHMWQQWITAENEYLQSHRPKAYADLVISGVSPFTKQLELH